MLFRDSPGLINWHSFNRHNLLSPKVALAEETLLWEDIANCDNLFYNYSPGLLAGPKDNYIYWLWDGLEGSYAKFIKKSGRALTTVP